MFDTSVTPKIPTAEVLGRQRRKLATPSQPPSLVHVGAVAEAMTFGPKKGFGGGFYNTKTGGIFRVGRGCAYWATLTEIAPKKPRKGDRHNRHNETTYSIVSFDNVDPGTIREPYLRNNARASATYWVNGPMWDVYNMDPNKLVPHWLKRADVWIMLIGYQGKWEMKAIVGYAVPFAGGAAIDHSTTADPLDRDAFIAGGSASCAFSKDADGGPVVTVTEFHAWEGDDLSWLYKRGRCALVSQHGWSHNMESSQLECCARARTGSRQNGS